MLQQLLSFAICVLVLISVPAISAGQPREAESQVSVQGTVEAVDQKARTVTIRGVRGGVVTLDVPPEAVRFDQVKVGDAVTATYYDRVSLRPKPAGEAASGPDAGPDNGGNTGGITRRNAHPTARSPP